MSPKRKKKRGAPDLLTLLTPRVREIMRTLRCADCGASMGLNRSQFGVYWRCVKWPKCSGAVHAGPDGIPKGPPANAETRKAREMAHAELARFWTDSMTTQKYAYRWLASVVVGPGHIGGMSAVECGEVVRLCKVRYQELLDAGVVPVPQTQKPLNKRHSGRRANKGNHG